MYHQPQVSLNVKMIGNLSMADGWHVVLRLWSSHVDVIQEIVGKQTLGCRGCEAKDTLIAHTQAHSSRSFLYRYDEIYYNDKIMRTTRRISCPRHSRGDLPSDHYKDDPKVGMVSQGPSQSRRNPQDRP